MTINALAMKQKDYEAALQIADIPSLKLLFADSASVIKDCIEIVNETALSCGIAQLNIQTKEKLI